MRMYVGSKASGEKIKAKIKEAIDSKKYGKYFSLGNVYEIGFKKEPAAETFYQGWLREDLKKKMRLRKVKSGDWFLYTPEPIDLNFDRTIWFEEEPEIINEKSAGKVQLDCLGLRTCRVVSKKKNTTVTEYGFFHRWFHSRMPNSDGEIIEQELAIVEFKDGSVRQIRPDHIIFGWGE